MNWDQIAGKWKELKGRARSSWGELSDDELDRIGGRKDELIGRIQQRYGLEREEAERQVDDWARNL
ncbi:CsbD family protein [Halomonas sp. MCCC 1A11036]|uniref:CsbD family protein n=1 Tax=Billgrantia zhangzhouensis TaxID=2733481 RepID=A0ABS9AGK7_9GAMM|nr:CsbD family protein [Halomonas zhangzhouensis]MCE8020885.1 CsbD family protein [Halomonas zhangzhouensis]